MLSGALPFFAVMHLVFSVAILPLIVGAIAYFVPVLTRSREPPRSVLLAPLLLQVTGGLVVLHFSGEASRVVLHAAAGMAALAVAGCAAWVASRFKHTLGAPHPCGYWYLAALLFLCGGVALVPAMFVRPEWYAPLRLIHLHVNTLGFVGLTAIGTLQVLLPTAMGAPDAEVAVRLRQDLPLAIVSVLAVAIGSALWWPLSLLGGGLWLVVVCRLGRSWLCRYGPGEVLRDGAAVALFGALCGFGVLIVVGIAHAFGLGSGHDAVPVFVTAFLMPLVTGALSQLLPVLCHPGRRTPARDQMREILAAGGMVRTVLFLAGSVFLVLGMDAGFWLIGVALLSFGYSVVRAFWFFKSGF